MKNLKKRIGIKISLFSCFCYVQLKSHIKGLFLLVDPSCTHGPRLLVAVQRERGRERGECKLDLPSLSLIG